MRSDVDAKPFLRWAGSKRKLLPVLSSYWNDSFERYVEPFMGSACLFFEIKPAKALLNDLNSDLVRTYKCVRSHPKQIAEKLLTMEKGPDSYYLIRGQSSENLPALDAACRFIYLNRFCFNGLFRTNCQGVFNVPYGGGRTGGLPLAESLKAVAKLLKRSTIKSQDFDVVLKQTKRGDFVYLDPPFAVENRRVFRQYGPQNFGIDDLKRLATRLEEMNDKGISFVMSYAYCNEALDLFSMWPKRKVFVQRNIAGFTKDRRRAAELIVSNIKI